MTVETEHKAKKFDIVHRPDMSPSMDERPDGGFVRADEYDKLELRYSVVVQKLTEIDALNQKLLVALKEMSDTVAFLIDEV